MLIFNRKSSSWTVEECIAFLSKQKLKLQLEDELELEFNRWAVFTENCQIKTWYLLYPTDGLDLSHDPPSWRLFFPDLMTLSQLWWPNWSPNFDASKMQLVNIWFKHSLSGFAGIFVFFFLSSSDNLSLLLYNLPLTTEHVYIYSRRSCTSWGHQLYLTFSSNRLIFTGCVTRWQVLIGKLTIRPHGEEEEINFCLE